MKYTPVELKISFHELVRHRKHFFSGECILSNQIGTHETTPKGDETGTNAEAEESKRAQTAKVFMLI